MGIDPARSATLLRAARLAESLERTIGLPGPDAERLLRSVSGIGVWTASEVRSRAFGDPDAVAFGDYHVARNIGWALIGEELDDAGLAELLEPYRGHRYRVQRLLELSGRGHPRRGPRMAPRTHLPVV
jgi:3-methyladenine DNA glycosylase/8-oxoguanine DNA glycosylase